MLFIRKQNWFTKKKENKKNFPQHFFFSENKIKEALKGRFFFAIYRLFFIWMHNNVWFHSMTTNVIWFFLISAVKNNNIEWRELWWKMPINLTCEKGVPSKSILMFTSITYKYYSILNICICFHLWNEISLIVTLSYNKDLKTNTLKDKTHLIPRAYLTSTFLHNNIRKAK